MTTPLSRVIPLAGRARFYVQENKPARTWDVLGPNGYYRAMHSDAEAGAWSAFLNGEPEVAEDARRRFLEAKGLIPPEDA